MTPLGRPNWRPEARFILFISQAFNLAIHVKFLYTSAMGEHSLQHFSDLSRNFYGLLQLTGDLPVRFSLPFVIWIGLNWQEVMEMLGDPGGRR